MIGVKQLEVSEETLCEIVNEYLSRHMPSLGVATGVGREGKTFRIHLAERQTPPAPVIEFPPPPDPPSDHDRPAAGEIVVRAIRSEGVR